MATPASRRSPIKASLAVLMLLATGPLLIISLGQSIELHQQVQALRGGSGFAQMARPDGRGPAARPPGSAQRRQELERQYRNWSGLALFTALGGLIAFGWLIAPMWPRWEQAILRLMERMAFWRRR